MPNRGFQPLAGVFLGCIWKMRMPENDEQGFLKELDKKLWTSANKLRAKLEKAIRKNMKSLGFELPVGGKR